MEVLAQYHSDASQSLSEAESGDNTANGPSADVQPLKRVKIELAPTVFTSAATSEEFALPVGATSITTNVPYDQLAAPVYGPNHPYRPTVVEKPGSVESYALSNYDFHTQFYQGVKQYATKPFAEPAKKRKRRKRGDPGEFEGESKYMGPWAAHESSADSADDDEEEAKEEGKADTKTTEEADTKTKGEDEEPKETAVAAITSHFITPGSERTIFHGTEERDYLGRTYMAIPRDVDVDLDGEPGRQNCFLPKKCIHVWSGHTKGVNAIRFLPRSAHLLLSAGMDNKIKLWQVYHDRKCLRTYMGHNKAVRDIAFNNDGRKFLSASYDKYIKLWDTETGQCIRSLTTKKIPYCVRFNPDHDKHNLFLAGCSDKKVYQFDCTTGKVVQEYDQHLGAVNTITFVDDNRRFVTTSDDKTLRAWEFDIPVVIKYIAEPHMHSMPSVSLHPNKKWLACQSLDNQIVIYGARDRFRINRKKRFTGHLVAGYACQVNFSPDGRFLMSGDSEGKMWFWDWKTCRVFKKMKAHDSVVMGCEWHPHETSKVATCGWDGLIKYWD